MSAKINQTLFPNFYLCRMQHLYYKKAIPLDFEGILEAASGLFASSDTCYFFDTYCFSEKPVLSFFEKWNERRWMKKNVLSTKRLVAFSAFTADQIKQKYPGMTSEISVQLPKLEEYYHPIDEDAKDAIRYRETNGDAYFIYRGPIHPSANLVSLLKGFSIFKKKMGSNMKLILCGKVTKHSASFLTALESYRYKEDIILKADPIRGDDAELIAASYALVHTCRWERFGFSVLKAMKSGVAVLTAENSSMSEYASMAGMYFNERDPADIGEKLVRIYKDEQMRQDMIGTGLSKAL